MRRSEVNLGSQNQGAAKRRIEVRLDETAINKSSKKVSAPSISAGIHAHESAGIHMHTAAGAACWQGRLPSRLLLPEVTV